MFDGIRKIFSPPPPPLPPPVAQPTPTPPPVAPPAPPIEPPIKVTAEPNTSVVGASKIADAIFFQGDASSFHEQGDINKVAGDIAPTHDGKADLDAVKQVHANEKLEHEALATKTPAQQAQYKKLACEMDANPQAHLALQMLLLKGKLTDDPKTLNPHGDHKTLLDELSKVESQPLEKGINRKELLGSLLRETAQPASITQKGRDTCTVTSMQILMARQNPAEYVRIVSGLAAPAGKKDPSVELANGQKLTRPFAAEWKDGVGRTASSQLWQNSMMDFAVKQSNPNEAYDPVTGRIQGADGNDKKDQAGNALTALNTVQLQGALNAVTGQQYDWGDRDFPRDQMTQQVQSATQGGGSIKATLGMGDVDGKGYHPSKQDFTVTGHDGIKKEYTLKDANGNERKMSEDEFYRRVETTYGNGPNREATLSLAKSDQQYLAIMKESLKQNPAGVPVGMKWGAFKKDGTTDPMGHEVVVTKVENGRVSYTNPHGDEESMPEQDFLNRMGSVTVLHSANK